MPEQEDERTAAICRQAALPMLRQRHLAIVPDAAAAPDDGASTAEPVRSPTTIGSATGPPDRVIGPFLWLDRPR
jgi:hypothetical protein